jgi:hypothetical protein
LMRTGDFMGKPVCHIAPAAPATPAGIRDLRRRIKTR